MDPITTFIVTALAAGAAAGLTATAEQAVKDAYSGIKQWIQDRYAGVELAVLEKDPKSATRRDLLAEELTGCQRRHGCGTGGQGAGTG